MEGELASIIFELAEQVEFATSLGAIPLCKAFLRLTNITIEESSRGRKTKENFHFEGAKSLYLPSGHRMESEFRSPLRPSAPLTTRLGLNAMARNFCAELLTHPTRLWFARMYSANKAGSKIARPDRMTGPPKQPNGARQHRAHQGDPHEQPGTSPHRPQPDG